MDRHALDVLGQLRQYDSFLDSLRTICDMGCGTGEDIHWWATLETRDDPPEPYNYHCFAVDKDASKLAQVPNLSNIVKINRDFTENLILPIKVDLMWSHDSLQYSHNPIETLRHWNEQMNVNAMLIISIQQHSGVSFNKYYSRSYSHCFYNYTPINLIYMLALNGFDCRDAYLLKKFNDPWIHIAVYKSDVAPMDSKSTSWLDLIDKKLLHPSIENSITRHGHLCQEEIVMPWLNKENYFIDYVSQHEIPFSYPESEPTGVFNTSTKSIEQKIKQGDNRIKQTEILKPISSIRPPKRSFKK